MPHFVTPTTRVCDRGPVRGSSVGAPLEECPMQDEVDVLLEVLQDCGWPMLPRGRLQLQAVRWSRLFDCLLGHMVVSILLPRRGRGTKCSGVDLAVPQLLPWRVCGTGAMMLGGMFVRTRGLNSAKVTVFSHGCCFRFYAMVPAWVHQYACIAFCQLCNNRACRGSPQARWAPWSLRRMSSIRWQVIRHVP